MPARENRIAYINLTGDYVIEENGVRKTGNVGDDPNLTELNAFIGALRGSVSSNRDTFLGFINQFITKFQHKPGTDVVMSISSRMKDGVLTHDFKITTQDKPVR